MEESEEIAEMRSEREWKERRYTEAPQEWREPGGFLARQLASGQYHSQEVIPTARLTETEEVQDRNESGGNLRLLFDGFCTLFYFPSVHLS